MDRAGAIVHDEPCSTEYVAVSLPPDARPVAFVLTRDRALTRPFYADVLGLAVVGEDPFAVTFDLSGTPLRLTTVADHVPSAHTVLGWSVGDITAAMHALSAKGVRFAIYPGLGQDETGLWTSPDGAARVCWFSDPEGNGLSLVAFGPAAG